MKTQIIAAFFILPAVALAQKADRKPAEAKADIACGFTGVNDEKDYGGAKVFLDEKGDVTRLLVNRPEIGKSKAHDFEFTSANAIITHVDKDQRVKDSDGELYNPTGGPSFAEEIDAKNKKGDRVILRINDHSYSGSIGSSISAYVKGKMLADPGDMMGNCAGKLMHPDTRRQEMEEEMKKEQVEQGKTSGAE